jgi:hypothetical protein
MAHPSDSLDVYIVIREDQPIDLRVRGLAGGALWSEVENLISGVLKNMEAKPEEIAGPRVYTDEGSWRSWKLLWVWK